MSIYMYERENWMNLFLSVFLFFIFYLIWREKLKITLKSKCHVKKVKFETCVNQ